MPPSPADFGLSPETTLVEIWTEFFDTPEPVVERRLVADEPDSARRAAMVEPDIYDETLAFGSYQMVLGRVFWLADERNERVSETPLIAVAKRWIKVDGRSILIEAVPFPMVEPELMKLPKQVASLDESRRQVSAARPFPTLLSRKAQPESGFLLAAAAHEEPGLVFDWVLVQPQSNYTFYNGQTYYVESGEISLSGTTTFYGGAVIKFAKDSYASLSISGDITCLSGSGPTILTAVHDNSAGQVISTTPQSGRYGSPPYLNLYYVNNATLNNLEFRFAKRAIDDYSPYSTHTLQNSKLIACDTGIGAYYTTVIITYVNFCQVPTPYYNYGSSTFYTSSLSYGCSADSDGDGFSDEIELTHFGSFNQTRTSDFDGDGLPNGWEWDHFGGFSQTAGGDYDGDGFTNLQEYNAGADPNTIAFDPQFADDHVKVNQVAVTMDILRGTPNLMAILVNNPNLASAVWLPYQSNPNVWLGTTDGDYEVWIGLKGRAPTSQPTWVGTTITRDTVQPTITITSPTGSATSRPIIQVQGFSPERLSSLEYDLSNASGTVTGVPAYVTEQHFNTNLFKITTNWFECSDIELATGANTITLRATDLAGNTKTTVLNYTFSLVGDTTPAVMTVHWPKNGAQVSGNTFTFRGQLDDPTATVTGSIVGTSGTPTVKAGLVERTGLVWIEGLPLAAGSNTLTLTMTDAAGNISTLVLTLTKSTVNLTVNDIAYAGDLYQPVDLSGTINVTDHKVWVNGKAATLTGNDWYVTGVPLNPGGTAVAQVRAIPNTDNNGNGTGGGGPTTYAGSGNPTSANAKDVEGSADKVTKILKTQYGFSRNDHRLQLNNSWSDTVIENLDWALGGAGASAWSRCFGVPGTMYFSWNQRTWGADGNGQSLTGSGLVCGVMSGGTSES